MSPKDMESGPAMGAVGSPAALEGRGPKLPIQAIQVPSVNAWKEESEEDGTVSDDQEGSQDTDDSPSVCRSFKRLHLQATCLLLLAATTVTLALLASRLGEGIKGNLVFIIGDAVVILLFVGYVALRCVRVLGAESLAPVCAFIAWLLSVLISLSPPSRRRALGLLDSAEGGLGGIDEPCDEGAAALWIGLLIVATASIGRLEAPFFWLLGQGLVIQHVFLELVMPRSECEDVLRAPGPTLSLPPVWTSFIQLSLLTLLVACLAPRRSWRRNFQRYLESVSEVAEDNEGDGSAVFDMNEIISRDMKKEEACLRELLAQVEAAEPLLASSLLPADASRTAQVCRVIEHVADLLSRCSSRIKSRNGAVHLNSRDMNLKMLETAALKGRRSNTNHGLLSTTVQSVAAYLNQDVTSPTHKEPSAECEPLSPTYTNRASPVQIALKDNLNRSELHIGMWHFDAIGVERMRGHVLQVVGQALLEEYMLASRPVLHGFLKSVEEDWLSAASLIAGLGHDIGHFGRNNVFLINQRHPLAVTYNDRSVLESFHAATLTRLVDDTYGDGVCKSKVLGSLSAEEMLKARQTIISLILSTDPSKHLEELAQFRMRTGAVEDFDALTVGSSDQTMAMSMLFRSADIGHSAKEWRLHEVWSTHVVEEFHAQGDEEKRLGVKVSPLCDREGFKLANSQVGFLRFICIPTWAALGRFEEVILEKTALKTKRDKGRCEGSSHSRKTCRKDRLRSPRANFADSGLGERQVSHVSHISHASPEAMSVRGKRELVVDEDHVGTSPSDSALSCSGGGEALAVMARGNLRHPTNRSQASNITMETAHSDPSYTTPSYPSGDEACSEAARDATRRRTASASAGAPKVGNVLIRNATQQLILMSRATKVFEPKREKEINGVIVDVPVPKWLASVADRCDKNCQRWKDMADESEKAAKPKSGISAGGVTPKEKTSQAPESKASTATYPSAAGTDVDTPNRDSSAQKLRAAAASEENKLPGTIPALDDREEEEDASPDDTCD
eukprot:TRINITY_DN17878_c0_g1_i1.p1 TRINITY_DN17878_c0_g1~~TRINITY_DN17878_c0_g1_i1.p1  ORF type:complete len:1016 (+),score=238.94 TRINITY_DN17878_c0_g1_i1:80-3127(+)